MGRDARRQETIYATDGQKEIKRSESGKENRQILPNSQHLGEFRISGDSFSETAPFPQRPLCINPAFFSFLCFSRQGRGIFKFFLATEKRSNHVCEEKKEKRRNTHMQITSAAKDLVDVYYSPCPARLSLSLLSPCLGIALKIILFSMWETPFWKTFFASKIKKTRQPRGTTTTAT